MAGYSNLLLAFGINGRMKGQKSSLLMFCVFIFVIRACTYCYALFLSVSLWMSRCVVDTDSKYVFVCIYV